MNDRKSIYDVASFYKKKAVHKASYRGMRYQIRMVERPVDNEKNDPASHENEENTEVEMVKKLEAYIWPEPFCFEKTPDDKKITMDFDFSEDGLDKVYEWICENYDKDEEKWEHIMNNPFEGVPNI